MNSTECKKKCPMFSYKCSVQPVLFTLYCQRGMKVPTKRCYLYTLVIASNEAKTRCLYVPIDLWPMMADFPHFLRGFGT